MLDLDSIKQRMWEWNMRTDAHLPKVDSELQYAAAQDLAALVAEVERLRGELHQAHREVLSGERVADDFYRSNSLNRASIKRTLAVASEWCDAKDRNERCCVSNVANNLMAEVERLENEAAVMQQVTLAGLVAEVERLREAIEAHRASLDTDDGLLDDSDRKLWAVLDA